MFSNWLMQTRLVTYESGYALTNTMDVNLLDYSKIFKISILD